jgi:hypothetical protein
MRLNDQSLVPGTGGKLTPTTFEEWFKASAGRKVTVG